MSKREKTKEELQQALSRLAMYIDAIEDYKPADFKKMILSIMPEQIRDQYYDGSLLEEVADIVVFNTNANGISKGFEISDEEIPF